MNLRMSGSFSCLTTSDTQPSPKLSQAKISTPLRAQQRPQRHFNGTRVRRRHNADLVISGNVQNFACQVNGTLQAHLAFSRNGASGLSKHWKELGVQPGNLAQGPEENCALAGRNAGFESVMFCSILTDG